MNQKLYLTSAMATLLLAGCQDHDNGWSSDTTQYANRDTAVCMDKTVNPPVRVADAQCQRRNGYGGGSGGSGFLWYYIGRQSAIPYYGGGARGGSFTRTQSATYFHAPASTAMTESVAISRGGFGSSASAHGGSGE